MQNLWRSAKTKPIVESPRNKVPENKVRLLLIIALNSADHLLQPTHSWSHRRSSPWSRVCRPIHHLVGFPLSHIWVATLSHFSIHRRSLISSSLMLFQLIQDIRLKSTDPSLHFSSFSPRGHGTSTTWLPGHWTRYWFWRRRRWGRWGNGLLPANSHSSYAQRIAYRSCSSWFGSSNTLS